MQGAEVGRQRLVRFHHCQQDIYCFEMPPKCPFCGQGLGARRLEEAALGIHSPFVDGHQEKCSFLLKPTQGTFLRDYDGHSDLHVGISSTHGTVYSYSALGVQRDGEGWEQSVSVPLLPPHAWALLDQWDKYLEDFCASATWLPHRYEEDLHNCYTFALAFINAVLGAEGAGPLGKHEFTERFVLPRTRTASKYITLYRAVEAHGFHATVPGPAES
ncbi:MKRN2 opposite strand protein [Sorex araneus]|uniref:MKRN2 opposite strand protein n=1 Tax=Sorex araneus TaxID=42254 RepID=UPI002433E2C3|nr:MKRN2 opposite strand protein [Sorex araneus]